MWLQMGGHCEPQDVSLDAAALREATEESGVDGADAAARRPGAAGPASDPGAVPLAPRRAVRGLAPPGAVQAISDESLDVRWFAYDEVAAVADESVVRLLEATRARL